MSYTHNEHTKYMTFVCSICLEEGIEGIDTVRIECGHYFHCKCIKEWENHIPTLHTTCPNCRHRYIPQITPHISIFLKDIQCMGFRFRGTRS